MLTGRYSLGNMTRNYYLCIFALSATFSLRGVRQYEHTKRGAIPYHAELVGRGKGLLRMHLLDPCSMDTVAENERSYCVHRLPPG